MKRKFKWKFLKRFICLAFILMFSFGIAGCRQKYSMEVSDALYEISSYHENAIFTPSSTIQITISPIEVEQQGLTAVCNGESWKCFTFSNLTAKAASVRFIHADERRFTFDVCDANDQIIGGITLRSRDWTKGCFVLGDPNIEFSIVDNQ